MTNILGIIIKIYGLLIQLYPRSFRTEFELQMLLDFSDMVKDASERGNLSFALFCLRELVDFPLNLIRMHLKEGLVFKVFGFKPLNFGIRGAIGFGLASFMALITSDVVSWKLNGSDNPIIGQLQVYFYDTFHTEHGLELLGWLSPALSSIITGLLFGLVIAILFADRSRYPRYILVGMLGWFLHEAVTSILWYSANLEFFLGSLHWYYFSLALEGLSGAFMGLALMIAKSETNGLLRWFVVGSISYPLIIYFYIRLLFKLSIIETPWMFMALISLLVVYLVSLLMIAVKSESKPKVPWLLMLSAVSYPLIPYFGRFIPRQILPALNMPSVLYFTDPAYWNYMFLLAVQQAIYVIPFGLLIGIALGVQTRSASTKSVAGN